MHNIPRTAVCHSRQLVYVDGRLCLCTLQVGTSARAVVQKVEEYGVFVELVDMPGLVGLIHKSEISWDPVMTAQDAGLEKGKYTHTQCPAVVACIRSWTGKQSEEHEQLVSGAFSLNDMTVQVTPY